MFWLLLFLAVVAVWLLVLALLAKKMWGQIKALTRELVAAQSKLDAAQSAAGSGQTREDCAPPGRSIGTLTVEPREEVVKGRFVMAPLIGMPQGAEWLVILAIVVLLFGSAKLPALVKQLGKSKKIWEEEVGPGRRRTARADRGRPATGPAGVAAAGPAGAAAEPGERSGAGRRPAADAHGQLSRAPHL